MNNQQFKIRRLRHDDINQYAIARRKLWPRHTIQEFKSDLGKLLKKKHFFAWIAVEDTGQIIAFVEASIRPYANGCRHSPVFFLEGIWVDAGSRKLGIGRTLLKHVEVFAKKRKFKEMGSDCLASNKISARIHLRWGYKKTMDVVYFRKDL